MEPSTAPKRLLPRRIVVGLDERGLADAALRTALELATLLDAKLEVVHAVPSLPQLVPGLAPVASVERIAEARRAARDSARAHVKQVFGKAGETSRSPDEVLRVVEDRPAHALLAESRSEADLIVLGAKRSSGVRHIGGTLRTLLAKAAGPVWVQSADLVRVRRMLVPIDMSPPSLHALHTAIAFAAAFGARVHVLHAFVPVYPVGWGEGQALGPVFSVQEQSAAVRTSFDQTLSQVDWRDVEHDQEFVEGDPVRCILERSSSCDLVVMGTHGHSGLAAALLGNVAWSVMERGETPLLVTHAAR